MVRRPRWDINRRVSTKDYAALVQGRLWSVPKDGPSLREDYDAGLVRDGSHVRFRPWPTEQIATPHGSIGRREYLYSHYQLLDLPLVERAVPLLRRPRAEWGRWQRLDFKHLQKAASRSRDLVPLLEALEPRYLPDIIAKYRLSRIGADDERAEYLRSFSAADLLGASGWGTKELYESAGRLIHTAESRDPLRGWLDLVRQVHPDMWPRLRGDALLAIELRAAAEMIYRLLERLQADGLADPFPAIPKRAPHELNMRIRRDRGALDDVLMSFGLSPHPAVVLALEGPTEMTVAPLAMEVLDIPHRASFIRLIDAGSETRDHGFMAQYVALPSLGPREGHLASFERPPTRYLIAVDGDRRFSDPTRREQKRQKWVGVLFESLPAGYQTPAARQELDSLVLLDVWADGVDFERAHFTDHELAEALMATGLQPANATVDSLRAELEKARAAQRPIDVVWAPWSNKPRKPELALLLWPALRMRLVDAGDDEARLSEIPIARVLLRAFDLAVRTPRRHVVFRLADEPRSPSAEAAEA